MKVVEDYVKDLGQRVNSIKLEAGRRVFYPKRRRFFHNRAILVNLFSECGMQGFLLCARKRLNTYMMQNHYINIQSRKAVSQAFQAVWNTHQ